MNKKQDETFDLDFEGNKHLLSKRVQARILEYLTFNSASGRQLAKQVFEEELAKKNARMQDLNRARHVHLKLDGEVLDGIRYLNHDFNLSAFVRAQLFAESERLGYEFAMQKAAESRKLLEKEEEE